MPDLRITDMTVVVHVSSRRTPISGQGAPHCPFTGLGQTVPCHKTPARGPRDVSSRYHMDQLLARVGWLSAHEDSMIVHVSEKTVAGHSNTPSQEFLVEPRIEGLGFEARYASRALGQLKPLKPHTP